LKTTTLLRRVW
jgi:hypothetical protein